MLSSLIQFGLELVMGFLLLIAIHAELVEIVLVAHIQMTHSIQIRIAGRQRGCQAVHFAVQLQVFAQCCRGGLVDDVTDV